MPYTVARDNDQIITVCFENSVDLAQRMSAVDEVCNSLADQEQPRLLIDVRRIVLNMSLEEQKNFGTYLAGKDELSQARVAVLHQPDNNPNRVINGYAYIEGYNLVEFSNPGDARMWLLGQLR